MESEDQKAQHARVEKLWKDLDTRKEGHLDLKGLKQGLGKLNHPLKNADSLLQDVLKAVDTNGDGRIQYSEFRKFVEETEKELWQLFKSIDRDHNGQLDKGELRAAFNKASILLPDPKLNQFFSEVDSNHDGVITFDEWRNFLLFIPAVDPNLRAVLSYYSSTMTVNPEGDVHISGDDVEGLGNHSFSRTVFGALFDIFEPPKPQLLPKTPGIPSAMSFKETDAKQAAMKLNQDNFPFDPGDQYPQYEDYIPYEVFAACQHQKVLMLTDLLPPTGYFIAGGIAGAVSRTATAPLDRLKVYLIAHVGVKDVAINHAKSGAPVEAAKTATRPLIEATKTLWRMGGMRSLFAGNGLNVVKVMPESAIKFGAYEGAKRVMAQFDGHDDPKALRFRSQFLASGFGGCISQFAIYPLDTLKFRMQNETVKGGQHGNALIITTARKMWASGGLRCFYRGLPMGLVGMFPYAGIDLTTYEYLQKYLKSRKARLNNTNEDSTTLNAITTAAIGAFAGTFGASTVYPLNLLRTRLQSQGTAIHPPTYTGAWDVTMRTIQGEGFRGLFKGITPNLLKVVPAVSITYVIYDKSKQFLGLK